MNDRAGDESAPLSLPARSEGWDRPPVRQAGPARWSLPVSLGVHSAMLALAIVAVGEPARFEGTEVDAISIDIVSVEEMAAPDPSPSPSVAVNEVGETVEPAEPPTAEPVEAVEARPVEEVRPADEAPAQDPPAELKPLEPVRLAEVSEPREVHASETPAILGNAGGDPAEPVPPPLAEAVEATKEAETPAPPEEMRPVETEAVLEPVPDDPVVKPRPKPEPPQRIAEAPAPAPRKAENPAPERRKAAGKAVASAQDGTGSTGAQSRRASGNASMSNYIGEIAARLQRQKRYPDSARQRGVVGTVVVTFTLSGSGSVTASRLVRSSGAAELDREVTAMLQRASPFPPIPDSVGRKSLTITVPIRFSLH